MSPERCEPSSMIRSKTGLTASISASVASALASPMIAWMWGSS